jgi:hypothetical protein
MSLCALRACVWRFRTKSFDLPGYSTMVWRVKELEWVTRLPRFERGRKVELCEMACDIGDDECCACFWIVESCSFLLLVHENWSIDSRPENELLRFEPGRVRRLLTVLYWPPERICVIDFAIDDFSATHSTIIPTYRSLASSKVTQSTQAHFWRVEGNYLQGVSNFHLAMDTTTNHPVYASLC